MKFTVAWLPVAQTELAQIWVNAADRNQVTATCHRVDRLLETVPIQVGESRGGTNRVLIEPPLVVLYTVVLDDLKIEVHSVRPTSP